MAQSATATFHSAPASSSKHTTDDHSELQHAKPQYNLGLVTALLSAPASSNNCTTSKWPNHAATIKAGTVPAWPIAIAAVLSAPASCTSTSPFCAMGVPSSGCPNTVQYRICSSRSAERRTSSQMKEGLTDPWPSHQFIAKTGQKLRTPEEQA